MALTEELIHRLRCPETLQPLTLADGERLEKIRELCGQAIDGALLREDGQRAYPIRDGYPVLLLDEAIDLS